VTVSILALFAHHHHIAAAGLDIDGLWLVHAMLFLVNLIRLIDSIRFNSFMERVSRLWVLHRVHSTETTLTLLQLSPIT